MGLIYFLFGGTERFFEQTVSAIVSKTFFHLHSIPSTIENAQVSLHCYGVALKSTRLIITFIESSAYVFNRNLLGGRFGAGGDCRSLKFDGVP